MLNLQTPEDRSAAAGEYVLGTLAPDEREAFERALGGDAALRAEVAHWQDRFLALSARVAPAEPSAGLWRRIEARLSPGAAAARAPAATPPWWQRLGLWQGAAGLATMAALALALVLVQPQPAPTVVVMAANAQAGAGAIPASFVVSVSADGRALVLRPIDPVAIDADRQALELWAVPGTGAPRSLGLVSPRQVTTVERSGLRRDVAAYAVSLEPAGGSPTGQPTGPILALGKLQG